MIEGTNPQAGKVTVDEFAAKIKEKYPEYKDVDNLKLAQAIVEKYPEYKEAVVFEPAEPVKKKDGDIPSASLDGESPSFLSQVNTFFQPSYDAADWVNKNIPIWSNWASVSTQLAGGLTKAVDGLVKEATLNFMPDSEYKESLKEKIKEKGVDEVLDTPIESLAENLSLYSEEIKQKRLQNYGVDPEEQQLGILRNISSGNLSAAATLAVDGATDGIIQSGLAALTGVAPLAISAGGEKYYDVSNKPNYSSSERVLYSTAVGLVEGLIESVFATDIKAFGKVLDSDMALKGFEKELLAAAKNTPWYKEFLKMGTEEGLEESLSESFGQVLTGFKEGTRPDPIAIAEAFVMGFLPGAGTHVITNGISAKGSEQRTKRRQELAKRIEETKAKVEEVEDPSQKAILEEMAKGDIDELNKEIGLDAELYAGFSEEDVNEIQSINTEIRKLYQKIGLAVDEDQKNTYKKQILDARSRKLEIENRYSEKPIRYIRDGRLVTKSQFVDMVNNATPEELSTGQWGVENDAEVEQLLISKFPQEAVEEAVPEAAPATDVVEEETPAEEVVAEEVVAEEVEEVVEKPVKEVKEEVAVDQEAISFEENEIEDTEFRIEDLQSEIDIEKGNIKEAKAKAKEDIAAVRKTKIPKEEKAEKIEEIRAELQDTVDDLNGNIGNYKEDINAYKSDIRKANKRISKLKTPKVVAKPVPKKKAKEQIKTEEVEITLLEENGSVKPLTKSGPTTDPRNVQTGKMTIEYGDKGITFKTTEDTGRMKEEGGEIFVSNEQISKMPNIGKFEKNTKEYAQHVASMSGIADPKPEIDPIEGLMSRAIKVEDIGKEGTASAKRFTAKQGEQLTAMVNNFEKILKSSGARRVKVLFFNQSDSVAYRSYKTGKDSFASKGSYFDNTIVVNIDSADMSTLPHEMLHAYISSVKMDDKKIVQFTNAIENELNKGSNSERELAKELAAFRDRYIERKVYGEGKTKEDALIAEEFLAQYVGLLSTASENMPKAKQVSFIDKIRAAVVKFLSKIGIVDKNLVAKIKTREDALNFINGFVDALQGRVDPTAKEKVLDQTQPLTDSPVEISSTDVKTSRQQIKTEGTYIKKSDLVDVKKLFSDFKKKNNREPNVWIWMSDQLKRGSYNNKKTGVTTNLEGGVGFAYDKGNKAKKIAWASGLSIKTLNERVAKADFIWFMAGSEKSSFNFSKGTTKTIIAEIEAGMSKLIGRRYNGVEIKEGSYEEFTKIALNILKDDKSKKWSAVKSALEKGVKVVDHPIRTKIASDLLNAGTTVKMNLDIHKFLHEDLGVPKLNEFHELIRDEFLKKNEYSNGDMSLIIKPEGVEADANIHDTYPHAILGEVVGMPSKKNYVLDVVPEESKTVISKKTGLPIEKPGTPVMIKTAVGDVGAIYEGKDLSIAREQIDWKRSTLGKGKANPAIVNRTTPVQEAALELLQGKITNAEYQKIVSITQPIDPITQFFLPASTKDMQDALDRNKAKLLNTPLEDGAAVGLRLDIPAYKNWDIWIVSIHDSGKAGKSLSYGSAAWATDVTFGSNPKVAAFIAAGQNLDTLKKQDKTTIARMHGKWKNFEGKTKEDRDVSAVKKVEEIVKIENSFAGASRKGSPWRQVGMNPFRHSFFYDRRTGQPVIAASEVVQIGGLVYAKDVVYADKNDPVFSVEGYKDANGDTVRFQIDDQINEENNNKATYEAVESNSEGLLDADVDAAVDADVSEMDSWKERPRTMFEKFIDLTRLKIQDKFRKIIAVQEDIEFSNGSPVGLDEDFRNAEALMHGKAKEELNKTEIIVGKIANLIKASGLSIEKFNDLLYAMHAQERNRYLRVISTDIGKSLMAMRKKKDMKPSEVAELLGISTQDYVDIEANKTALKTSDLADVLLIYGTTPSRFFYDNAKVKDGSGMTDVEAREILAEYGLDLASPDVSQLKPRVAAAVQAVRDLSEDTRNRLLESGLETQATIDAFTATYKNYVPLRGFADGDLQSEMIEGGRKLEVRGREKRAKGRTTKADSPLTQVIISNTTTIVRAEKNSVMNRFYNLAVSNPNKDVYEIVDPKVTKEYKREIRNGKIITIAKTIADYMSDPNMVSVRVGGEYKFIRFKDASLADALKGANVVKAEWMTKYLGAFNRTLSSFITTYDPEFVLRNFSRDIQTAVLNLFAEQEMTEGLIKDKSIVAKVVKDVLPAIKSIAIVEGGKSSKNKEMDQYYREFKEDGAKTEWFYSKSSTEVEKDIKNLIEGKGDTALKAAGNLVERINSAVENGVRLSAYVNARKAGVSRAKSAELAKNLTVNFNKSGEWGQIGNTLFLFFNASVQGTSRLMRSLKPQYKVDSEGNRSLHITTAQKMAIGLSLMGSIMSVLNELGSDDDEDEKSFYSKIPDFEKERNIIIMKFPALGGDGKGYWKIPLPYGVNVFYVTGTLMADAAQKIKTPGEVAGGIMQAAVGSFSPINFPNSDDTSKFLMKFAMPTIGQVPLALAVNENYFGQTIYNENFPFDTSPKPESELGRKGGNRWTKELTKFLNKVSGGSEFRSGSIDINPDAIDFVMESYSGGMGKFLSRSANTVDKIITGNWDEIEPRKVPFLRVFYGQSPKYANVQEFYTRSILVNQMQKEVKAGIISGAEANRVSKVFYLGKNIRKQLSNLKKREDAVMQIKDADVQKDKMKKLEELRYKLVADYNKQYERFKIDNLK